MNFPRGNNSNWVCNQEIIRKDPKEDSGGVFVPKTITPALIQLKRRRNDHPLKEGIKQGEESGSDSAHSDQAIEA